MSEEAREKTWATSDLPIAAYAYMKGLQILEARRLRNRDFEFVFSDPHGQAPALRIEYANSECRKFDDAVRSLKRLIHEDRKKKR